MPLLSPKQSPFLSSITTESTVENWFSVASITFSILASSSIPAESIFLQNLIVAFLVVLFMVTVKLLPPQFEAPDKAIGLNSPLISSELVGPLSSCSIANVATSVLVVVLLTATTIVGSS